MEKSHPRVHYKMHTSLQHIKITHPTKKIHEILISISRRKSSSSRRRRSRRGGGGYPWTMAVMI
jgi:hypothetical protein